MFKLPGYRRRKAKQQLKALKLWGNYGTSMHRTAQGFFETGDYVGVEAVYLSVAAAQRKRVEKQHKANK